MSNDTTLFTLCFPVPTEAMPKLAAYDMLVVPGTAVEIEAARNAIIQLTNDHATEHGADAPLPEALSYLVDFLNRAIPVRRQQRGPVQ